MRAFIDTNLWAYRLDRRDPDKAEWIREWLQQIMNSHDVVISTQVLIELRSVATKKLQPPLSNSQIQTMLDALSNFEVVATDANLVLDANLLAQRHQLNWFDALIAEAAIRSNCTVLFSEDFNHGSSLDGLEMINPFKAVVV